MTYEQNPTPDLDQPAARAGRRQGAINIKGSDMSEDYGIPGLTNEGFDRLNKIILTGQFDDRDIQDRALVCHLASKSWYLATDEFKRQGGSAAIRVRL